MLLFNNLREIWNLRQFWLTSKFLGELSPFVWPSLTSESSLLKLKSSIYLLMGKKGWKSGTKRRKISNLELSLYWRLMARHSLKAKLSLDTFSWDRTSTLLILMKSTESRVLWTCTSTLYLDWNQPTIRKMEKKNMASGSRKTCQSDLDSLKRDWNRIPTKTIW